MLPVSNIFVTADVFPALSVRKTSALLYKSMIVFAVIPPNTAELIYGDVISKFVDGFQTITDSFKELLLFDFIISVGAKRPDAPVM